MRGNKSFTELNTGGGKKQEKIYNISKGNAQDNRNV